MASTISRPGDAIRAPKAASDETTRYLDLCLVLTHPTTGDEILRAGGRWDRLARRYVGDAVRGRVVQLKPSQLEVALYLARWLDDYRARRRPRDHIALLGGARRGGKTFITVLFVVVMALEVPEGITWIVSPTIGQRDEIERVFEGEPDGWPGLPETWGRYSRSPGFTLHLANGSTVRNLSGAIPRKRGKAHALLLNEAQDMGKAAATYAVPAIVDKGGLVLLAANPPDKARGNWINKLRDKLLDDESDLRGRFFNVDPALNPSIDQTARADVARTLAAIDEDAAKRDAEGLWLPVGDRAYPAWTRQLIRRPPELGDITREYLKHRIGRAYDYVGGVDFQGTPHQVGVLFKVFGTLRSPIFVAVAEVLVDRGTEDELLDELFDRGYTPETVLWIGDASSQWQDAKHSTKGRDSFSIFRSRRWHIEAPQRKRSDRGIYAGNPHVADRLGRALRLMQQERVLVSPACPWLIESFAECPLGDNRFGARKPYGKHSHVTDAATYALFWLEPDPGKRRSGDPLPPAMTITDPRRSGGGY